MFTVAALYHFTRFEDPAALRGPLIALCRREEIRGSLLLAREGINGTVAGPRKGIDALLAHIRALPGCADLEHKESTARVMPFGRMKVRLKREIVTMGQPDVDPLAGFHNKRIAMFCTGGIRCEKSTNFLLGQGYDEVYHLKGGILKYLEEVPPEESLWNGACFVFDGRVSIEHGLKEGPHILCHACRRPLMPADTQRPEYEEGVSCHLCHGETSEARKERFRERQRQICLARERGKRHLGAAPEG